MSGQLPWGQELHRLLAPVRNPYRTTNASDREYGAGGRIRRAEAIEYEHDPDGHRPRNRMCLATSRATAGTGLGVSRACCSRMGAMLRMAMSPWTLHSLNRMRRP